MDDGVPKYIQALPRSLKIDVANEVHRSILNKVPMFRDLEEDVRFELAHSWQRVVYLPNDIIVSEGQIIKHMFIVTKGNVMISIKPAFSRIVLTTLVEGKFFGENSVLSHNDVEQTATVCDHHNNNRHHHCLTRVVSLNVSTT